MFKCVAVVVLCNSWCPAVYWYFCFFRFLSVGNRFLMAGIQHCFSIFPGLSPFLCVFPLFPFSPVFFFPYNPLNSVRALLSSYHIDAQMQRSQVNLQRLLLLLLLLPCTYVQYFCRDVEISSHLAAVWDWALPVAVTVTTIALVMAMVQTAVRRWWLLQERRLLPANWQRMFPHFCDGPKNWSTTIVNVLASRFVSFLVADIEGRRFVLR